MDYGHKWTDKELKKLEKRISAEYTKAAAEMQKKVEKYYADFARKDEIKRKEVSEGKISQSEYTNWRRNQMLVGKRWEEMQANLAQDMHTVNMKTASMTRQFSYDAYAMNFNYGTFEAESGSGIDTAFTLYDRSTVERLIRDDPDMLPPPGKKVSQRIREGKDVLWNKQVIQSVMTQSILQGESIPNIATRLAEAVGDTNRKAAIRNARTMTTGAENAGREDSYKRAESMGIKMQQMWIATLDCRTRHEHRQLDGQKRKVGEPFEVSGQKIMFPGDPKAAPYLVWNCRCTLIGIVANSDVEYYKERMDEKATIKGYPGMTYEEWKNEHAPKAEPTPVVGETESKEWKDVLQKVTTKEEAIQALNILFGSVEKSFLKNDEGLIIANTNRLLELNQRFGCLTENNKGYITASTHGRALAWASTMYNNAVEDINLSLVGAYYQDPANLRVAEKRSRDRFFSMPFTDDYIDTYAITHEYGHILEAHISKKRQKWGGIRGANFVDNPRVEERARSREIYNEIIDIAKANNPDFKLRDNLSEYGHSNHFEAFAEIFANSQCGAPNELGIAMQQWLEKEGF